MIGPGSALDRVEGLLSEVEGRVLVAMSGGVDSCTLAFLAVRVLGTERVLAVTAFSESTSQEEVDGAVSFAGEHGIRHRVVEHSELEDPAYVANRPDRCYHCREGLMGVFSRIAEEEGYDRVAMGYLPAGEEGHAPGRIAAKKAGAWFPWAKAGVKKEEVRGIAERLGLSVADRPSNACLSSRIPYGERVTREKLAMVEEAEAAVRGLVGVAQVRVRHHGDLARVEVAPEARERLVGEGEAVTEALREVGFRWVSMDLLGYRRGSLNEGSTEEREKPWTSA